MPAREMDSFGATSPAALFPAGAAGEVELDDFDAIGEVSPVWDQEHVQLGRGPARVRATLAHTASMQVAEIERSPAVRVRGRGPRDAFVLATLVESGRQTLQGLPWDPAALAVLPPGAEFELMGSGPHRILVVSVRPSRLDEECLPRWGRPFPRSVDGPFLRFRDEASRDGLIRICRTWVAAAQTAPALLVSPQGARRMEEEILAAILDGVERHGHLPPVTHRREIVRRADTFLRASLRDRVTLQDICSAVRISPRGLHAAFDSVYGIPPKAYWKVLRLNAVRRELRRARPGTRVSEVAARWGFFQLGYFSVDYRKLFGESPRDTLRTALDGLRSHSPARPGSPS